MKRGFVAVFLLLFVGTLSLQPICAQAEEKKFLIGLIPEMNIFKQKQRFDSLGEYLSKKTGVGIKFTILSRYGNIIESFEKENARDQKASLFKIRHQKIEPVRLNEPSPCSQTVVESALAVVSSHDV